MIRTFLIFNRFYIVFVGALYSATHRALYFRQHYHDYVWVNSRSIDQTPPNYSCLKTSNLFTNLQTITKKLQKKTKRKVFTRIILLCYDCNLSALWAALIIIVVYISAKLGLIYRRLRIGRDLDQSEDDAALQILDSKFEF